MIGIRTLIVIFSVCGVVALGLAYGRWLGVGALGGAGIAFLYCVAVGALCCVGLALIAWLRVRKEESRK